MQNTTQDQARYIRLKFEKGNEVKYISHLDLMRAFQRALRRTELPIAYSGGFNPHQELSFGAPLSLGVESIAEYVDIKFTRALEVNEVIQRMNEKLPKGITLLDGVELVENFKSAMGIVTHARYTICMDLSETDAEKLGNSLQELMNKAEIIVKKEQPKKNFALKEIDIKPMILELKAKGSDGTKRCIECLLLSGSKANLKPELLLDALKEYSRLNISGIRIKREAVYAEQNGQLLDLIQYAKHERQ